MIIFTKSHEDWTKKCGYFVDGQFFNMAPFFDSDFIFFLSHNKFQGTNSLSKAVRFGLKKLLIIQGT